MTQLLQLNDTSSLWSLGTFKRQGARGKGRRKPSTEPGHGAAIGALPRLVTHKSESKWPAAPPMNSRSAQPHWLFQLFRRELVANSEQKRACKERVLHARASGLLQRLYAFEQCFPIRQSVTGSVPRRCARSADAVAGAGGCDRA